MKRSLAAGTVLAFGAVLGTGTAATFASWQDQITIDVSITAGYIHFAVDDPNSDPAALNRIDRPGQSLTWTVPENVLDNLAPEQPQSAVVQIDAQSQGNRGLSYTLDGASVAGDNSLTSAATVTITAVGHPGSCGTGSSAPGPVLYEGPIQGAATESRELVTSEYTDAPWTNPETEYLCLAFTVPDGMGSYTNEGTVTGTAEGGLEADQKVTATDTWSGRSGPSQAARNADVTLTFSYETYRPGEEP
ncbi:SipW-dependent-type signal peptide-containing protein [Arthrobacter castelli]|uniref:SipW-dependent-type signal peptide-containing protein n=1 Tax=Arthrobacter castelli TaxID=271431 RepID=UPI0003FD89CB|nr:SipW-dependent-type signal peptide-containing protein [Arthrobacter castelli]